MDYEIQRTQETQWMKQVWDSWWDHFMKRRLTNSTYDWLRKGKEMQLWQNWKLAYSIGKPNEPDWRESEPQRSEVKKGKFVDYGYDEDQNNNWSSGSDRPANFTSRGAQQRRHSSSLNNDRLNNSYQSTRSYTARSVGSKWQEGTHSTTSYRNDGPRLNTFESWSQWQQEWVPKSLADYYKSRSRVRLQDRWRK